MSPRIPDHIPYATMMKGNISFKTCVHQNISAVFVASMGFTCCNIIAIHWSHFPHINEHLMKQKANAEHESQKSFATYLTCNVEKWMANTGSVEEHMMICRL